MYSLVSASDPQVRRTAPIDLRSDAYAPPTDAMWSAMQAEVHVWRTAGTSEAVAHLEAAGARMLGKEAALLVSTTTQANLVAVMTLAGRGTNIVVESRSHIATLEDWGAAYVAGVNVTAIAGTDGAMAMADIERAFDGPAFFDQPNTSLVCLENTHNEAGGAILERAYAADVIRLAHAKGAVVHLDGARLLNAAAAAGVDPEELARGSDTVSLSLNKALGAPFGGLLAGPSAVVAAARRNVRRLGAASIHNDWILAAAALAALSDPLKQARADNELAAELSHQLRTLPNISVINAVETNIIMLDTRPSGLTSAEFVAQLRDVGVLAKPKSPDRVRLVTNRLVDRDQVPDVVAAVSRIHS